MNTTDEAAVPPKLTVAPFTNPVPEMITDVPPALGPEGGATEVTAGGALNVKPAAKVFVCASVFVTTTLTAPAEWAGVTAVIVVPLETITEVAADPPKVTVAPARNPVPEIVIDVPPAVGPEFGSTLVGTGGGTNV